MSLDVVDPGRIGPGVAQCGPQNLFLRFAVRCREPGAPAVVVDRAALDQRENAITVGERIAQALEDDDSAPLAADVTIRVRVESLATGAVGNGAELGEINPDGGTQYHIDAAGQAQIALPVPQTADCLMHGDQRGGAGRLDRHRRSTQVEAVGNPPGRHTERRARAEVLVEARELRVIAGDHPVLAGTNADEHAGQASLETLVGLARVFQRLPRDLQQQALLGVHALGFARTDAEELGVEAVDLLEKAAPLRIHLARAVRYRIVVLRRIPAVRGDALHAVHAGQQRFPKRVRVGGSGKSTRHSNDGDVQVRGHASREANRLHCRAPCR